MSNRHPSRRCRTRIRRQRPRRRRAGRRRRGSRRSLHVNSPTWRHPGSSPMLPSPASAAAPADRPCRRPRYGAVPIAGAGRCTRTMRRRCRRTRRSRRARRMQDCAVRRRRGLRGRGRRRSRARRPWRRAIWGAMICGEVSCSSFCVGFFFGISVPHVVYRRTSASTFFYLSFSRHEGHHFS
ncbi:myocyte enhancer factor 2A [Allomyces macrogynus ATCC 38327]|uniref:Myocyte enhancer factor 2A n=1 Tax=Allomyces macrogynus (strain ATCC 38327) TaxID=578462 RepID=A0A0L0T867_ALLM3|nr:myocyte enhancer factor 2A [Allomyces macrogynus ATCC 38327]|eukprot:KNE70920.1 myocyte enhancer factor 2A [Allomyces macrogynus ATCC 38327]